MAEHSEVPTSILISTPTAGFGTAMMKRLVGRGHRVGLRTQNAQRVTVRHRPDLPFRQLVDLLDFLSPIEIDELLPDASLESFDIHLCLGGTMLPSGVHVSVEADSERIGVRVADGGLHADGGGFCFDGGCGDGDARCAALPREGNVDLAGLDELGFAIKAAKFDVVEGARIGRDVGILAVVDA